MILMVEYLIEEEIIEINRLSLESSEEEDEFHVIQPDDVRFIVKFAEERFEGDLYKKALAYCISLIVTHPFKNGNHRTSLYCSEHFLLKNDFVSSVTMEKINALQKWRVEYEEKYDLQRDFFNITNIYNDKTRRDEIEKIMNSEYGLKIEEWLKENYK